MITLLIDGLVAAVKLLDRAFTAVENVRLRSNSPGVVDAPPTGKAATVPSAPTPVAPRPQYVADPQCCCRATGVGLQRCFAGHRAGSAGEMRDRGPPVRGAQRLIRTTTEWRRGSTRDGQPIERNGEEPPMSTIQNTDEQALKDVLAALDGLYDDKAVATTRFNPAPTTTTRWPTTERIRHRARRRRCSGAGRRDAGELPQGGGDGMTNAKPVKKLTELTVPQKDRMASFADEWVQYGWRTTPLTEEEWSVWEAGARKCYEFAGIPGGRCNPRTESDGGGVRCSVRGDRD